MPNTAGGTPLVALVGSDGQTALTGSAQEQDVFLGQITDAAGNPLIGTELNSLGNNNLALASVLAGPNGAGTFINSGTGKKFVAGGANGNGVPRLTLHLHASWASTTTANSSFDVWILRQPEAATPMESGSASVTPTRVPDLSFPVGGVASIDVEFDVMPAPINSYAMKLLVRNNGTGQAMSASGNYVKGYAVAPGSQSF